uniref:Nardilysin-like n=1 Tax=Crassostrea virginica TaxID=6565 RepID=A0A8B8CJB7_CRAVI|nr:nardilysin-like [Crassostrea virginica]
MNNLHKYGKYLKLIGRETFLSQGKVLVHYPYRLGERDKFNLIENIHKYKRSYSVKMEQPIHVVKSENDKRNYRWINLENGLQAILISDLLEDEEEAEEAPWDDEEEGEHEDEEESHQEEEMETDDEEEDDKGGEKKSAAALCISNGSFSDPPNIPGLAHFLEHMVFMGSKKYPQENKLDDFLSKHGGFTNAWTDCERTSFHFDVEQKYFHQALDIFAQFFIHPLLRQDSVDREIQAVDSEYQMSLPSDDERACMLYGSLAKEGHPMGKFFTGSFDSLKTIPQQDGIDVYDNLKDFEHKMYSAQFMTLAVQSKVGLDKLEKWVREIFSEVPNNKLPRQTFDHLQNPFDMEKFGKLYYIDPVKDKNMLEIIWSFPPMMPHYRKKPLSNLDFFLGHEGEGSLLAYLKSRYFATAVESGHSFNGFELNTTATQFVVNLTLTELGLERFEEVLLAVFQYIHMLKTKGVQKQYYDEMKTIEETKFRFKEKGDAMDYVERVSENMQLFAPVDVLTGRDFLYEYDPELIAKCLSDLRADNCCIFLSSKLLADKCDRQDIKWCPVKYGVDDIKPDWRNQWIEPPLNPHLTLPQPNKSIATDFALAEVEAKFIKKHPTILTESDLCTLYYKKDTKFKVPKAYVCVQLLSPVASQSVKSQALLRIFEALMNHKLDAPAYPAILAGYDYSIHTDETGLRFKINGFNQKLLELFDLLLNAVFEYSCDDELFPFMRNKVKRELFNDIIKPAELVRVLRFSVIDPNYQSSAEMYAVIDTLTNQDLQQVLADFRQSIKADVMVVGNVTPKEATCYKDRLESKLSGKLEPANMLKKRLYQVPKQWSCCQINSFNMEDANSSITVYLQSEPGDIRATVLNELLDTRMEEPCFDVLRTQLQLGYTVYCQNLITNGILGLAVTVQFQAQKFTMREVDNHIEDFLNKFKEILDSMTKDEFDTLVESLIAAKQTEDTYLGEEVKRYWSECTEQNYLFDRLEKEIAVLKTLTLEDLQDWYKQFLGENQRRISFQVLGNPEVEQADMSATGDEMEPPLKKANTARGHQSYTVTPVKDASYQDHQCITDICKFRSGLTLHNHHCITK